VPPRPARAADHRWFGDKRSQVVHDLDHTVDECAIDDLLAAETFLVVAPDTLVEARNRCYHPCRHCGADGEGDGEAA
jgi:hypothetical protein